MILGSRVIKFFFPEYQVLTLTPHYQMIPETRPIVSLDLTEFYMTNPDDKRTYNLPNYGAYGLCPSPTPST